VVETARIRNSVSRIQQSAETEDPKEFQRINQFSVFTFNLWGHPRKGDKSDVLSEARVKRSMEVLWNEIEPLSPWVIAFQEYNGTVFDHALKSMWHFYSGCNMEFAGVKIGVHKDVECRVAERWPFEDFEGCDRYARKYQSVEIKVGKTWVTVVGLHLISGRSSRSNKKCKIASMGYSFSTVLKRHQPGVIMGDLNWFARSGQEDVIPMRMVPNSEHFIDAAITTNNAHATFPAWDEDLKNPTNKFAARLDRVFFTAKGLTATGYKLINRKAIDDHDYYDIDEKYSYCSDHVGSYVSFELVSPKRSIWNWISFGRAKGQQWAHWPENIVNIEPENKKYTSSGTKRRGGLWQRRSRQPPQAVENEWDPEKAAETEAEDKERFHKTLNQMLFEKRADDSEGTSEIKTSRTIEDYRDYNLEDSGEVDR